MANLKFDNKLQNITVKNGTNTDYYSSCFSKRWEEIKTILGTFGITLPSEYEVDFAGDEYQIRTEPKPFGAVSGSVLYKDTVIAHASVDGSNYCDREAKLVIYMDLLKAVYKTT